MFHLLTLHKHVLKALSQSPRKLESVWGNKGFTESESFTMKVTDALLVCPLAFLRCIP